MLNIVFRMTNPKHTINSDDLATYKCLITNSQKKRKKESQICNDCQFPCVNITPDHGQFQATNIAEHGSRAEIYSSPPLYTICTIQRQ